MTDTGSVNTPPKLSLVSENDNIDDADLSRLERLAGIRQKDHVTLSLPFPDGVERIMTFDQGTWAIYMWLLEETPMNWERFYNAVMEESREILADIENEESAIRKAFWSEVYKARGQFFKAMHWSLQDGVQYIQEHYAPLFATAE